MTDWTVDRLEALPVDTMITDLTFGVWRFVRVDGDDYDWSSVGGSEIWTSADLLDEYPEGFRVVSVPVDALIDPTASEALMGGDPRIKRATVRAAIAHVTGEA